MIPDTPSYRVTVLLFDNMAQLDATGPIDVFSKAPGFTVQTVAKSLQPIRSDSGLKLMADFTLDIVPPTDILCIPGGPGINPLLTDPETLTFIKRTSSSDQYVTSVCSGALLLGAAGLLQGRKATTHWSSLSFLDAFGCTPVRDRVVFDGNLVTGGGVTAGIDFAFALIERLLGRNQAAGTMLAVEYNPSPPFQGGSVETTDPAIVEKSKARAAPMLKERADQVAKAASNLAVNDN